MCFKKIIDWQSGLELEQTAILEAMALDIGPSWQVIAMADVDEKSWPLLAEGQIDGRPAILIAFDISHSDLPLRPAFPLLMAGIMDQLAPASLAGIPSEVTAGQSMSLRLSARTESVSINRSGR